MLTRLVLIFLRIVVSWVVFETQCIRMFEPKAYSENRIACGPLRMKRGPEK